MDSSQQTKLYSGVGQLGLYVRVGTVKILAAPSKFKPRRHRIGAGWYSGTCRASLRTLQGVGLVRIQIDPSPSCLEDIDSLLCYRICVSPGVLLHWT